MTLLVVVLEVGALVYAGRDSSRWSLGSLWPFVVTAVVLAAVFAGFDGQLEGAGAADYAFNQGAGIPASGTFRELASDGDFTYLQDCKSSRAQVIVVRKDEIAAVRPIKTAAIDPSLLDILFTGARPVFGLHPCL
jgi:hypothetical protein